MADLSTLTVLFLAANPAGSSPSRLGQEAREIGEGLLRARDRDRFHFEQRWAVRARDVRLALLECNPQIVHFSGNREPDNREETASGFNQNTEVDPELADPRLAEGLVFEDNTGRPSQVSPQALADLFKLFSDQVNCVLLNGCYSNSQAQAIVEHIPYVVGTRQAMTDSVAMAFALGFYDALGAGRSIEFAYKLGCSSIPMEGLPEHLMPVLYKKSAADAISTTDEALLSKPKHLQGSRKRAQEKREDLEEEYQDIRQKTKWLKQELIIKSDSEAKFELSQRVQQYEAKLHSIEDLLKQLENS
ncbi:MAG: hypothetical protein WA885_17555 [Phormidesmis sp.]